jgi:hypothetical protein
LITRFLREPARSDFVAKLSSTWPDTVRHIL